MKLVSKLFVLGFAIIGLASCGNNNTDNNTNNTNTSPNRGLTVSQKFMGKDISLHQMNDIITIHKKQANADQDAALVANLFGNLQTAQNKQALEVAFSASDEAVTNGMFIFSIQTENSKQLTMEMYDEEGFELAGNNIIDLTNGQNYKALNVKELNNGNYIFRLKDEEGKELTHQVKVQNQQ